MVEKEWNANEYDRLADPQTRWGTTVLERLALDGDESVLDAGCGSGRVTELLADRVPRGHVVAMDVSTAMVAAARERLAPRGDAASFVVCDLLELTPEALGGFAPVDAIFSTATFHWVNDHDDMFKRLAAVIRRGGQLVAQCGGKGNIATLMAAVASLGVPRVGEWLYADVPETLARLEAAGFEPVAVWLNPEPTSFPSDDDFAAFLETVCLRQHVATLPLAERTAFTQAVVDALPGRELDYVRLNITARRR